MYKNHLILTFAILLKNKKTYGNSTIPRFHMTSPKFKLRDYRLLYLSYEVLLQQLNTFVYSYFENVCRKKNTHGTILKANLGYDQYTVPGIVAVEPTFVTFL